MTPAQLEARIQQLDQQRHQVMVTSASTQEAFVNWHQLTGAIGALEWVLTLIPPEAPAEDKPDAADR